MAYYSPTPKRKSIKDLERENKKLRDGLTKIKHASTLVIQAATDIMAKKELAVAILESVNEQAATGKITKHELFQWRLNWNQLMNDNTTPTEIAFSKIGVDAIGDVYQDIYTAQEKIVSELLLGYFLTLDETDQWKPN